MNLSISKYQSSSRYIDKSQMIVIIVIIKLNVTDFNSMYCYHVSIILATAHRIAMAVNGKIS